MDQFFRRLPKPKPARRRHGGVRREKARHSQSAATIQQERACRARVASTLGIIAPLLGRSAPQPPWSSTSRPDFLGLDVRPFVGENGGAPPFLPPSGPAQWLFQGPPAKGSFWKGILSIGNWWFWYVESLLSKTVDFVDVLECVFSIL